MSEKKTNPEKVQEQDNQVRDNSKKQEIGGRDGPEPTRYGDWEVDGRCTDF